MNKTFGGVSILGLSIGLLLGCGDGSTRGSGHLIEGKKPTADELTERIRQAHKIHVYFTPDDKSKAPGWYEVSQDSLVSSTNWNCQYLTSPGVDACSAAQAEAGKQICIYMDLLRVMESGVQPYVKHTNISLDGKTTVEGTLSVPQQSTATIATIAQYLRSNPIGQPVDLAWTEFQSCSLQWSEDIFKRLVNDTKLSVELTEEMTDVAVKNILAASDGTRSSAPPGLGAEKQAWTQPVLSRAEAARMLLGGNLADHGFEDGFCPGRPLGAGEKKAVELLRTSGVSVGDLGDSSLSTDDLLHSAARDAVLADGSASNPAQGSVAKRLALVSGSAVSQNVPATYGLTLSDFDKARSYLVAESNAFARDGAQVDTRSIQDPSGKPSFSRFTASTMPAAATPDALYATLATGGIYKSKTTIPLTSIYADASLLAMALRGIPDSNGYDDSAKEATASLITKVTTGVRGILNVYESAEGCSIIKYNIADTDDSRARFLLVGESALTCATKGTSGSLRCTKDAISPSYQLNGDSRVGHYYPSGRLKYSTLCDTPLSRGQHYYLVTRRAGTQGNPGDFDLEGGFVYDGGTIFAAVMPALQAQAAEIVRPSESWCNMPRQSCAGASFDERLPLEDELTNDSDGVESSWKHYLNLAKEAASQADSLGQAYVNAALQYDQKISDDERYAESRRQQLSATIETLQDACGTELDVDAITKALIGDGAPVLNCSDSSGCGSGKICVAGVCIADLKNPPNSNIADVKRLQRCIGLPTIPFAALGDQTLCVATVADYGRDYCPKVLDGSGIACPGDVGATDHCASYKTLVTNYANAQKLKDSKFPSLTAVEVAGDALLRLFTVSGTVGSSGADEGCRALAKARNGISSYKDEYGNTIYPVGFLGLSDTLLPTDVAELAKRIGFEARLGGYAAVTLDDVPMDTTGAIGAPSKNWPCASETISQQESLLESHIKCEPSDGITNGTELQQQVLQAQKDRGVMNDRLMRAVIALRFIGGVTNTSGLTLPLVFPKPAQAPPVYRTSSYDPDGTGATPAIRVYESRMTGQGIKQSIFWSDNIEDVTKYPAAYTMWNAGTDPTEVTIVGGKLVAGGGNWDVWFGTGELNTKIDASGETYVEKVCHWEVDWVGSLATLSPVPKEVCENKPHFIPAIKPVSTAAWLHGLYRSSLPIDPRDEGSDATGWYLAALKARQPGKDQVPVKRLDGHIQFAPTTTVSDGSHSYQAYANNGALAFGDVVFGEETMLDALELYCKMKSESPNKLVIDLDKIPSVASPEDFTMLQLYMNALARRVEDWAGSFVIPEVPIDAIDFSRSTSKAGAFPKLGGSYATAVTALRADLVTLSEVSPMIAQEIRMLGLQLEQAKVAFEIANNGAAIAALKNAASKIEHMTQCMAAIGNAATIDLPHAAGAAVAATAVCAGGVALSIIDDQVLDLQQNGVTLDKQQTIIQLQQEIYKHGDALQKYGNQISEALENIDGHLAEIERQRDKAQRAAAEAIRQLAFENAGSKTVSSDLAAIRETARLRYEYAFDVAKRATFLARRAIEQRLAVNMDELTDDMPLVEAPQRWAGTVCERSGIDWNAVQASHPDSPASFADSFMGDYVSKLERVVESYRLDHNFHEGSDTSVVSLRDDVTGVRAPCDVQVDNLLFNTTDISVQTNSADLLGGWRPSGCASRTDTSGKVIPPENCIAPVVTDDIPYPNFSREVGAPKTFRLAYGCDLPGSNGQCPVGMQYGYDYQPNAKWAQRVKLNAGRYRVSWYATGLESQDGVDPQAKLWYETPDGTGVQYRSGAAPQPTGNTSSIRSGASWYRFWYVIDVNPSSGNTVDVDFTLNRQDTSDFGPTLVAGAMVEDISADSISVTSDPPEPKPFTSTSDTRVRRLEACQDTTGDVFRSKWVKKCVPLCPDGNVSTCPPSLAIQQCYWEVPFSISQARLLAGQQFKLAGFSQGNFNYRISTVGVNVVGTGVKNCANALLPSTCYSSGNITYSLDHAGPYMVRNYEGADYETKLFTGHIQHARGLAAERYITNPISSTDEQLLDQYMRTELQGRPLDGNFILKIWDDPNTSFAGVQDIQVILKYSYWTRFD